MDLLLILKLNERVVQSYFKLGRIYEEALLEGSNEDASKQF